MLEEQNLHLHLSSYRENIDINSDEEGPSIKGDVIRRKIKNFDKVMNSVDLNNFS